jgi:hypothetical protein
LYLEEGFQVEIQRLLVRVAHSQYISFEFVEVGCFAKFDPGSSADAGRYRVSLPDLTRQRFKLVCDSSRIVPASQKE